MAHLDGPMHEKSSNTCARHRSLGVVMVYVHAGSLLENSMSSAIKILCPNRKPIEAVHPRDNVHDNNRNWPSKQRVHV